jgi:hypothetical protein
MGKIPRPLALTLSVAVAEVSMQKLPESLAVPVVVVVHSTLARASEAQV